MKTEKKSSLNKKTIHKLEELMKKASAELLIIALATELEFSGLFCLTEKDKKPARFCLSVCSFMIRYSSIREHEIEEAKKRIEEAKKKESLQEKTKRNKLKNGKNEAIKLILKSSSHVMSSVALRLLLSFFLKKSQQEFIAYLDDERRSVVKINLKSLDDLNRFIFSSSSVTDFFFTFCEKLIKDSQL